MLGRASAVCELRSSDELRGSLVIRNGGAAVCLRLHDAAAELIGAVCLSLFSTWTMMTWDLGEALRLAGPLLIILAAQAVLVAAWATWVTFPLVGRDYESAVISGAFCGFAMGATATAIANMQALTRRHGPSPQAFVIVPIVGASVPSPALPVPVTSLPSCSTIAQAHRAEPLATLLIPDL